MLISLLLRKMFFLILSRVWDKEKIPSPHEESNVRPSESALWTIIDDKVCKLALRVIVLSTLGITSLSEEKKSILTGFFRTKNGLHLYPDFFSWQEKYKSTNGLFFLSLESIAELRPIFSIILRLLKFI